MKKPDAKIVAALLFALVALLALPDLRAQSNAGLVKGKAKDLKKQVEASRSVTPAVTNAPSPKAKAGGAQNAPKR